MGADLASDDNPGNNTGRNSSDNPGSPGRNHTGKPAESNSGRGVDHNSGPHSRDRGGGPRDGDESDVIIPVPRSAPDTDIPDSSTRQQETGVDRPSWWYDHPRKRGADRRYWGEVEWIGGPEADELRDKLTEIVRDLLDWAHTEQQNSDTHSNTASDDDSGEDGDIDDSRA